MTSHHTISHHHTPDVSPSRFGIVLIERTAAVAKLTPVTFRLFRSSSAAALSAAAVPLLEPLASMQFAAWPTSEPAPGITAGGAIHSYMSDDVDGCRRCCRRSTVSVRSGCITAAQSAHSRFGYATQFAHCALGRRPCAGTCDDVIMTSSVTDCVRRPLAHSISRLLPASLPFQELEVSFSSKSHRIHSISSNDDVIIT